MKRFLLFSAFCLTMATGAWAKGPDFSYTHKITDPAGQRYNITEGGAVGDGKTLNTKVIQQVIDACSKNGGGTVVVPKGFFLTGALFLKKGVNLELQSGGVLKGSTDINDYPKMTTRIEGHFEPWRTALLNADSIDHLRISGPGMLDGSGQPFWKEFYSRRDADKKTTNLNVERPRLTFIRNSRDVKINGVTFLNSGFWNLHLYDCREVAIDYCKFQAPSGPKPYHQAPSSDGIDVDCSRDVAIRHCFFSVGDDCIALKGSKGPFAMNSKDAPVERVEISDCIFEAGGGIVTFGSEATVVRDVTVKRCTTLGPTVLRLKLRPDTPQQYENITMSDITLVDGGAVFKVSPWTQYFDLKGQAPPKALVRNVKISNIHGKGASWGEITGHDQATISDIMVENADVDLETTAFKLGKVQNLLFKNVKVNGKPMLTPDTKQTTARIDRKALVERHKVINTTADTLGSLTVGNGKFAFTVDITGLQTFPVEYQRGVPLGTQSEWGWNSFKDTIGYKRTEALRNYHLNGRDISYLVQRSSEGGRGKEAADWFRANPHRLQLGNLGFEILKKNGVPVTVNDIQNAHQELNPWTGEIVSKFSVEGTPVEVITYGHGGEDAVAAKVSSPLIKAGRLKISIRFPYPTAGWSDYGVDYSHTDKHASNIVSSNSTGAWLRHRLQTADYLTGLQWKTTAVIKEAAKHHFLITPDKKNEVFEFTCLFTPAKKTGVVPSFYATLASSQKTLDDFWNNGGVIDFSGSTDKRAMELERRVVLSQYLMKVQEAGDCPPQETGLTYNSWYGKAHLEMTYWHLAHYPLWGRTAYLEKIMDWYAKVAPFAKEIAARQGFEGLRWQKVVEATGEEVPSSVGAFLIWQQPHYIYFAELIYRNKTDRAVLDKYKDLVFATADFMASFAYFDKDKGRYILGKGLIPAQERFKAEDTFNPTYELVYWQWGLEAAQQWRLRLGLPRNKKWDDVLAGLSPLPVQQGVYLAAESAPDSYTNPAYKTDHPSVLAAYGVMPKTSLMDTAIMNRTFKLVWDTWTWKDTWGWDFPMTAMSATRLGLPDKAIDALFMPVQTNTYLSNGHNYQENRLTLYMPGNGGLLAAVAMMVAGYDGSGAMPGIPKDGSWKVKWEGLKRVF